MTCESSKCQKRCHSAYLCPLWRFLRQIGWLFSVFWIRVVSHAKWDEHGGVQPQRSNPPRMFTTDDEAYGQERLSFMFTRCMGAKAAVGHSGVATGFTRLVGRWNVRATGHR